MGLALAARCKLNLYLSVRARRADGYHEIETLFHSLGLADELTLEPDAALSVECRPALAITQQQNLAWRALSELADYAGVQAGARVTIEKRVPEAAGLGGGSADAAAALVGANSLWQLGWPLDRLRTVGSAIGADVPFLLGGGAAIGRGRGDSLDPVAPWPGLAVALALPKRRLSTAEVYASCAPDPGGIPVEGAAAAVSARSLTALTDLMRNDLTDAACRLAPEIGDALGAASSCGVPALMSGSGPTVFALSDDPERLAAVCGAWEADGFEVLESQLAAVGVTQA